MPGLVCQVIKKRNCDKIRIQINSLYQEWWNPPSLKLRNGERELRGIFIFYAKDSRICQSQTSG